VISADVRGTDQISESPGSSGGQTSVSTPASTASASPVHPVSGNRSHSYGSASMHPAAEGMTPVKLNPAPSLSTPPNSGYVSSNMTPTGSYSSHGGSHPSSSSGGRKSGHHMQHQYYQQQFNNSNIQSQMQHQSPSHMNGALPNSMMQQGVPATSQMQHVSHVTQMNPHMLSAQQQQQQGHHMNSHQMVTNSNQYGAHMDGRQLAPNMPSVPNQQFMNQQYMQVNGPGGVYLVPTPAGFQQQHPQGQHQQYQQQRQQQHMHQSQLPNRGMAMNVNEVAPSTGPQNIARQQMQYMLPNQSISGQAAGAPVSNTGVGGPPMFQQPPPQIIIAPDGTRLLLTSPFPGQLVGQMPMMPGGQPIPQLNQPGQQQAPILRMNPSQMPHMQHMQQQPPSQQQSQQQGMPSMNSSTAQPVQPHGTAGYSSNMYPQQPPRIPVPVSQSAGNYPPMMSIPSGSGNYPQPAVPQGHTLQPPSGGSQSQSSVAPATETAKKRPVIRDKEGNIVDITSFKKAPASAPQINSSPQTSATGPTSSDTAIEDPVPAAPARSVETVEENVKAVENGGEDNVRSKLPSSEISTEVPVEKAADADVLPGGDVVVSGPVGPSSTPPEIPPEKVVELGAEENSVASALSGAVVPEKRNKKALRDMLSAADSNTDKGTLLDAYTSPAAREPIPAVGVTSKADSPPITVAPVEPVPRPAAASHASGDDDEDDWEATAAKIELGDVPVLNTTPASVEAPSLVSAAEIAEPISQPQPISQAPVPAAPRRLAPGGGLMQQRLNQGPAQSKVKVTYPKEDILKMRPLSMPERPPGFGVYTTITSIPEESNKGGSITTSRSQGYWNRGELTRQFERSIHGHSPAPTPSAASSGQQTQHQFARDGHHNNPYQHPSNQFNSQGGGGGGGNAQTQQYWKRMQDMGRGNRNRGPAPPRPKKIVTDPVAALSLEVMSLLNKIAPQTFDKLLIKLSDLHINTFAKLDKFITLIFEKAIQEPNFAYMYAELCVSLEKASRNWSFIQVVFNEDLGQFFYIRDLEFETETYGPFDADTDCVQAVMSGATLIPVTQVPETTIVRTLVSRETLIQVGDLHLLS
jgi:hypothetical protein